VTGAPTEAPTEAPERPADSGAAVVEFVLVSVLLLGLFLSVVQLGFALYVRNTLVACAADGARYAANADRSPADGARKARELIRRSLPDRFAEDIAAGYEPGSDTVFVQVRAALPLLGPWGVPRRMVLRGHALEEGTP
jgi:Flp pilus assembly protein TadG